MPQLDDIVQRVILEGDDEIASAFDRIADKGKEIFDQLSSDSKNGITPLEGLANAAVGIEAIFGIAATALIAFANSTNVVTIQTRNLASSFGVTGDQLSNLETIFAAAGINSMQFARIVQGTTRQIADGWDQVLQNVRNAATENEAASNAIIDADLKVQTAQQQVTNGSADRAAQMRADNNAVITSTLALQNAITDATTTMRQNFNSVSDAALSLEQAQANLAALEGHPPSAAEQRQLQLKQAQLAVVKAQQAQEDALNKQIADQAAAESKIEAARIAAADAARKRDEDAQKAIIQQKQDIVALADAENALEQARQKQHELELNDLTKISETITALGKSGGDAAGGLNLAEVSVQNIVRAIQLLASKGGNAPNGLDLLKTVADVFHNDTNHIISDAQRITIAAQLAGGSMRNMAGPQLVTLLNQGSAALDDTKGKAAQLGVNFVEAEKNAESFRTAMTGLEQTLTLVKIRMADAINPALSAFLNEIDQSLTESTGLLHNFVSGLEAIGSAIGGLVSLAQEFSQFVDKMFDVAPGTTFKTLLLALAVIIAGLATPFIAWPIIIGLVIVAVGSLVDLWGRLKASILDALESSKQKAIDVWDSITQGATDLIQQLEDGWNGWVAFFKSIWDQLAAAPQKTWDAIVAAVEDLWTQVKQKWNDGVAFIESKIPFLAQAAALFSNTKDQAANTTSAQGAASGGLLRGPGTSTSDSIPLWGSVGEYMIRAAAVKKYGVGLMHLINSMQFDPDQFAFALGGLISFNAPRTQPALRLASGGVVSGSKNILNLTIGKQTFAGLMAPDQTMDDLQHFAVRQQVSSAGRKPRWHR